MHHVAFSDRLYVPAIDAIALRLNYVLGQGWMVHVAHCHSGEDWEACRPDAYGPLETGVVLALAGDSLAALLEWP